LPVPHTIPQSPQFTADGYTQAPLRHWNWPAPHVPLHVPLEQTWPAEHVLPQPPQLRGSLSVSVHTPLQFVGVCPLHDDPHLLCWQTSLGLHAMPQPPQFCGSTTRDTHRPPQATCSAGQPETHSPSAVQL
jgi:hypothetical protein